MWCHFNFRGYALGLSSLKKGNFVKVQVITRILLLVRRPKRIDLPFTPETLKNWAKYMLPKLKTDYEAARNSDSKYM